MEDKITSTGVIYQCVQCGSKISLKQLSIMLGIKCPNCGYRVLRKTRPLVVRKVKAL